ncbi:hypothetical protein OSB04_014338 [Centaurea solstitialis]|uniref:Uncharacterized protein n=1 Tax=Centaurea solstitialis TaxID=347529 RepID=A0AA38T4N4_9ASTR|nr:hypothetical protein OSB04_014338 [Centaurea solstitialis]
MGKSMGSTSTSGPSGPSITPSTTSRRSVIGRSASMIRCPLPPLTEIRWREWRSSNPTRWNRSRRQWAALLQVIANQPARKPTRICIFRIPALTGDEPDRHQSPET